MKTINKPELGLTITIDDICEAKHIRNYERYFIEVKINGKMVEEYEVAVVCEAADDPDNPQAEIDAWAKELEAYTDIDDIFQFCGITDYVASRNLRGLIPEYTASDAFDLEDVEEIAGMSDKELKELFNNSTKFVFLDFGTWYVFEY